LCGRVWCGGLANSKQVGSQVNWASERKEKGMGQGSLGDAGARGLLLCSDSYLPSLLTLFLLSPLCRLRQVGETTRICDEVEERCTEVDIAEKQAGYGCLSKADVLVERGSGSVPDSPPCRTCKGRNGLSRNVHGVCTGWTRWFAGGRVGSLGVVRDRRSICELRQPS
jgi:hypothetical protein